MAVGQYNNGSGDEFGLIEEWDGSVWSLVDNPNASSTYNEIDSVSCTSETFCMAVGRYGSEPNQLALSDMWNGTGWQVVPTYDPGTTYNWLTSVSCLSSTDCMSVGVYLNSSSDLATMSQEWSGSTWFLFYPTDTSSYDWLSAVSCTSSTSCLAVGFQLDADTSEYYTLLESWNGSTWAAGSSPSPSSTWNVLTGVDCTSSTECVMVGYFDNPAQETLVEYSDSDSVVPSPNPGTSPSSLAGVTCVSAGSCVAVGSSAGQTLVEAGSTPPPTITSFNPTSGSPGTTVVIKGKNFSSLTNVTFNGTQAAIAGWSNTKITVTVPTGATTGKIQVTTEGGTATSQSKFTVT
jgi:hypothetical protein